AKAISMLPLLHEGVTLGSLVIASDCSEEIPAESRVVLEAIAAQASGTIARIRAQAALQLSERKLLEISDLQQARIGQELHDGLCQQLVSLAFDANTLTRSLESHQDPLSPIALRIAHYLDEAITQTRQLSRGLFPIRIEMDGLVPALEELARSTTNRFGLSCQFTQISEVQIANPTASTHLFRIAQEAVTNAVKHSQAQSIQLELASYDHTVQLTIEDDGTGFDPAQTQSSGMGLHIMNHRARTIGGALQILPAKHQGTIVLCRLPLP
ncbi:MAG TPA: sensor histidine kinase, partial [Clostridia bacterium]|nr:sensor histidine kinase [Clostridia bacterium]